MRSLAGFDLDGTLLRKNSSFAFIRFLAKKGFFSKQELLLCYGYYLSHRFSNLPLLNLHEKVLKSLFRGKTIDDLQTFLQIFIDEELKNMWYHPALHRFHLLKQTGAHLMLLSNSPTFLVQPIAATLGVDRAFGTEYALDANGSFSAIALLLDGRKKAELLQKEAKELEIVETCAFSDSLLDLPFLESAKTAIAVKPHRALKRIAKQCRWEIL
ncbi:MAG: HAD-IB family hydrolase [Chlamydiales bacterium]